ncbi:hypothetical protein ISR92_02805 [Patescibacteria group bacterium]|nr:hypothetical protein [Patescibacteria group bacterium]
MKKIIAYLSAITLASIINTKDVAMAQLLYGVFPTEQPQPEPTTIDKILDLAKNQIVWLVTLPIILIIGILLIIKKKTKT